MANVPLTFGGGSGSGSDDCTGAKAQARAGYTFICSDTDDEPAAGLISDYAGSSSFTPSTGQQTIYIGGKYAPNNLTLAAIPSQHGDSGNVTLHSGSTSKSYAAGWYGSSHGAQIVTQTKAITPSTSQQTVSPDSGKVLSGVTVNAIPGQTAGGTITLTAATPSVTKAANSFLTSALTVQVPVYNGSVT